MTNHHQENTRLQKGHQTTILCDLKITNNKPLNPLPDKM